MFTWILYILVDMSELECDHQTCPRRTGGGGAFLGRACCMFPRCEASSWLTAPELAVFTREHCQVSTAFLVALAATQALQDAKCG